MAESPNNMPADPVTASQPWGTEDDLLGRIQTWDKLLEAHWSGWRIEAKTCFDMVAGRQWTTAEETQMEELGRIPVVFNRIAPTIDAVSGAEIQGRQQVQYFPRNVGDTAIDDVLTQGADWVMDECDGNEEDSDASRDCLICGIGVTETRTDPDMDSHLMKERIDPLEMAWDSSSRKACFADARYLRRKKPMSLEEFKELWPDASPQGSDGLSSKRPVIVDPTIRYDGTNGEDTLNENEVFVREYQWFDRVKSHLVGGALGLALKAQYPDLPMHKGFLKLTPAMHDDIQQAYPGTQSAQIEERHFYRAFVVGSTILDVAPIEAQDFTYKAMTGKRDRNKGWWYGLVRPMIDPQKWANKFYSQILHIMRTNAQGGLVVEESAATPELEKSWADPSSITYVQDGTLSNANGKKMEAKPVATYPEGLDRLMEVAVTAIRDTTGVNQEMLGSAERMQPGILESQRKQQAYGILAAFFDSFRRYRKMQGRLLLKMMQLYLPPDKLARIVGPDGTPQYAKIALTKDAAEYDVVIDEAPAGPNQKMQTFQVLSGMMPLLQNADLDAQTWADIVRYSPLPAGLAEKIAASLIAKQQAQQQAAPQQQAIQQAHAGAQIAEIQGQAAHHNAQAQLLTAKAAEVHVNTVRGALSPLDTPEQPERPDALAQEAQRAQIVLDHAKAGKLMAETVSEMTQPKEPAGE